MLRVEADAHAVSEGTRRERGARARDQHASRLRANGDLRARAHELRRLDRGLAQRLAGVDDAPGHPADPRRRSTGAAATNVQLSRERAHSVETALASRGVTISEVAGLGAALPLATNETPQGRQKNRRVEIWALN